MFLVFKNDNEIKSSLEFPHNLNIEYEINNKDGSTLKCSCVNQNNALQKIYNIYDTTIIDRYNNMSFVKDTDELLTINGVLVDPVYKYSLIHNENIIEQLEFKIVRQ